MFKFDQKGFTIIEGLLVAIVVLILGFGGYYIYSQNSDDDTANSANESIDLSDESNEAEDTDKTEVEPEEEIEATLNSEVNNTDLFSSGSRNESTGVLLDFYVAEGFSDYWAEIGATPDDLSLVTDKKTDGLGYAIDTYGGFTIVVDPADLPKDDTDDIYFYRIAATKDAVTQYTGVSAFSYK